MSWDLVNNIKLVDCLDPIVVTADTNGATIDRQGYHDLMFIVYAGAAGDTFSGSLKMDLKLFHDDASNMGTEAAVTDANYVIIPTNTNGGVVAAPDANGIWATIDANGECGLQYKIQYRGPKRYVRVKLDVTGTHSTGTPWAITALLSGAQVAAV